MGNWITYAEQKPAEEKFYEWRMPSKAIPGLFVRVKGMNRRRGAGFETVLSPTFDGWNGYSVLVPAGLQWRELEVAVPARVRTCDMYDYAAEGVSLCECPFCKSVPSIEFGRSYSIGGTSWRCEPEAANQFRVACCHWIGGGSFDSPSKLAEFWNSKLAKEPTHDR